MQEIKNLDSDDVRIHLVCRNMFLSLAFGFYLKGHLSGVDEADFIITDIKNLQDKYAHLPICVVGVDLIIPCSVFEMFSQLHSFYNSVNEGKSHTFHKDMQHLQKFEKKHKNMESKDFKKDSKNSEMIESIKEQKMQDLMKNIDPALSGQVELLFNELSQKIYDTLRQK